MSLEVRPRRASDLAALGEVLGAQQPTSHYPMRWPLPFPVEQFIARDGELAAWTALVDGRPAGHVSVTGVGDAPFVSQWSGAHGLPAERLGVLSVLFVDTRVRRTGLGRRLHDVAVGWLRRERLGPCLDVIPVHEAAVAMYAGRGWREVGRGRPAWLPAGAPDMVAMVLPAEPGSGSGPG